MKKLLIALALLLACNAPRARGQAYVHNVTITTATTAIVTAGSANYVTVQENSYTPSALFTVTDLTTPAASLGLLLTACSSYTFVPSGGFAAKGVTVGTIAASTSGPFTFAVIESVGFPPPAGPTNGSCTSSALTLQTVSFATLPSGSNGIIVYCMDCDDPASEGAACGSSSGKAGAEAHYIRGAWACF